MAVGGRVAATPLVMLPSGLVSWPPQLHGEHGCLEIGLDSVQELRASAVLAAGRARVRELRLTVTRWVPPSPGWSARLGALPGLLEHGLAYDPGRGSLRITVVLAEPVDLGRVLTAAVRAACPHRPDQGPVTPEISLSAPAPVGVTPALVRVHEWLLPGDELNGHVRRTDLLVTGAGHPGSSTVLTRDRVAVGATAVVDPQVHRPIGRDGRMPGASLDLVRREQLMALVDGEGATVLELSVGNAVEPGGVAVLQEHQVRALLPYGSARVAADVDLEAAAGLLIQLSATGVTVALRSDVPLVPGASAELDRLWRLPLPDSRDLFEQTVASVSQRREAHRSHGVDAVLRRAGAQHGDVPPSPTVSVLLVTMRPDRLDHALAGLGRLEYPGLQVVVGLHGDGFDPAEVRRTARRLVSGHEVVVVPLSSGLAFGAALGVVTARAEGALVTKVDDDDWYGPDHIWDLVTARDYSAATVVGKPPEYTYLQELDLTVRRPGNPTESYSGFVAGGTMMMSRADLDSLGGWRPVARSVDRGVLQRVEREGGLVYCTHGLGYLYVRHGSGHTWDPGLGHFLRTSAEQWPGMLAHRELGTGG